MVDESTASPSDKNIFYRDYYAKIVKSVMILIGVALIAACVVLYQVLHRPIPTFHAAAPNGQHLSLVAYNEPNFLASTILKWASKAAVAAYTFDFVNYQSQIEQAHPYFTEAGWQAYKEATASLLSRIAKNQLFVSGVVAGTPVIVNQGDLTGHGYTWRVQIPFLVTYQSAEDSKTRDYMITLLIVKVPTNINPDGIGIDKFQMV